MELSPSLISLTVSVDVKHNVLLLLRIPNQLFEKDAPHPIPTINVQLKAALVQGRSYACVEGVKQVVEHIPRATTGMPFLGGGT